MLGVGLLCASAGLQKSKTNLFYPSAGWNVSSISSLCLPAVSLVSKVCPIYPWTVSDVSKTSIRQAKGINWLNTTATQTSV
jgi:hypothetical protein